MTQRRKICAANWKMYKTVQETTHFFREFFLAHILNPDIEVIIAPPFTALSAAHDALKGSAVRLAAQNCQAQKEGAFTGEISPVQLKEVGCDTVILGHSERRHLFSETDEMIAQKIKAVLKHGLSVIFCVGETIDQRKGGQTEGVLERQLKAGLSGLSSEDLSKVVVAYEPVWAIGTGEVATPELAESSHQTIRKVVWDTFTMNAASTLPILYGGSVKPDNISALIREPNIDGVLVGGASLALNSFIEILKRMA